MNRIFKVIWSKTRGCYVAVSELAKTHSHGSTQRSRVGSRVRATIAATAAIGLLSSLGTGVMATDMDYDVSIINGHSLTVSGPTYLNHTVNINGVTTIDGATTLSNISSMVVQGTDASAAKFQNGLTIGDIQVTRNASNAL